MCVDYLNCVSSDPGLLLRAARFTSGYVRLVGHELAPSKCVFSSTSKEVRKDMQDRVLSQDGDKWSVEFDVRDLGRHLDIRCLLIFAVGRVFGVDLCSMSVAPCSSLILLTLEKEVRLCFVASWLVVFGMVFP